MTEAETGERSDKGLNGAVVVPTAVVEPAGAAPPAPAPDPAHADTAVSATALAEPPAVTVPAVPPAATAPAAPPAFTAPPEPEALPTSTEPARAEPAPSVVPVAGAAARPKTLIIERILRDRESLWREVLAEQQLNSVLRRMLVSSVVSLALYGLVLGASAGPLQALSSAVKLPLLFLLTLAICLPTLYLFNLVFGARLSIRQALALVLVAVTVTGALTLAFAPISLFFLITASDYAFFKLLNVLILMLTGFIGLSVMVDGMRGLNRLSGHEPEPRSRPASGYPWEAPGRPEHGLPPAPVGSQAPDAVQPAASVQPAAPAQVPGAFDQPVNTRLLYVWALLFGFVGTQLAWTLRPFIGEPNHPFQLFRDIEGSFYSNVLSTIASLF